MRGVFGGVLMCLIGMNDVIAKDTPVFLTPPTGVSANRNLPLAVVAEYSVTPDVRRMAENAGRSKPSPLVLALPGGRALKFSVRRFEPREGFVFSEQSAELIVDPRAADTDLSYYWYGVGRGTELSFTVERGRMTGTVTGMLGRRDEAFDIVESHGQRVLRQIDRSLYPPEVDDTGRSTGGKASAAPWTLEDASRKRNFARTAVVTLLVLHTDNAVAQFGGAQALSDFIGASIGNLNTALQNSQLIGVQVVNVMPSGLQSLPIAYDESPAVDPTNGDRFIAHRRWVRESVAAANLRDAYEADIVVLMVGDSASTSGIAYVQRPDCGGPTAEPGCVVGPGFSPFAFAVVGPLKGLAEHIFPHEVGHLFGMEHNPPFGPQNPAQASFPWSYGHTISSETVQARSIMAYDTSCSSGCPIQLHFSNPLVDFMSLPGVPSGSFTPDFLGRSRFNARSAAILAADVAEFRGPVLSTFDIYGHGFESLPDIICDPNLWPSCPSFLGSATF